MVVRVPISKVTLAKLRGKQLKSLKDNKVLLLHVVITFQDMVEQEAEVYR